MKNMDNTELSADIHADHRNRLRAKYLKNGIESIEEHEILELMLFSVMKRVNTNHVGHELIKKFGSLSEVFDAPKEELMSVYKVGEASADFLKLQNDMFRAYQKSKASAVPQFTQKSGMQYIKQLFADNPKESRFYMILLGSEDRIISADILARGEVELEKIPVREIISKAVRMDAIRVVFAHNHINGNVMPSDADIQFTKNMNSAFSYVDIEMNDHVVVAGNTAVSIRNDMRVLD